MWKFLEYSNRKHGLKMQNYRDLYSWSVGSKRTDFWADLWEFAPLIHSGRFTEAVDTSVPMENIPHWFKGTHLNFAENMLFSASPGDPSVRAKHGKEDDKIALTEIREGNTDVRHLTYGETRRRVGLLANAMREMGVKKGDRVAVVASTSFDTFICFMAIASIGGLFSSSSTDMGTKGILERLLQIRPAYVFVDDWAVYNGKTIDLRPKIREIVAGMEDVSEFKGIIAQPRFPGKPADVTNIPKTTTLERFLESAKGNEELSFERVEFRDPFLVVYSSGTTGVPKCIVHSVGGVLISNVKEGILHRQVGPENTMLQYTTVCDTADAYLLMVAHDQILTRKQTGWIMYMASIQCLMYGCRAILYDGSPFVPSPKAFLSIIEEQRVTHFGTSPRFLHELEKLSIIPRELLDLSALKHVITTGMVLSAQQFEWFYDHGFPQNVQLANISGGTDLAASFACENPLEPVYAGGCQGPVLGTKMEVYDSLIETGPGKAVSDGEPGDLVATESFPNQPVFFWGDESGERYQNAYYRRFPHVWTHGDFIQYHPVTGQVFFLGRADGVLNPSGVRFGSSDIYSVIEAHFPTVADSICVGQRRPEDIDESVMLFLKMKEGEQYTESLVQKIKSKIAEEKSRRHVPRYVFQTWDIPVGGTQLPGSYRD